jgi:divalent metal cation (Fe/Co/Zn/Cd) transporter
MQAPITLTPSSRTADVAAGVRVELVTVAWMLVEAVVAIVAGLLARSVLLTAFGVDSVIELVSGGTLLWRLWTEAKKRSIEGLEVAENRAAWVAGAGLAFLCIYIVASSTLSLAARSEPDTSLVGISLAALALVIMPILVWRKRVIAARIKSAALRADAACSLTCAYMALTLFIGLGLNAVLGWWWADAVAALALLYWIVPEAREALEAARSGRGSCGCGDPACDT